MEMTSFEWVTADRFVQKTVFGNSEIEIIANFGKSPYNYKGKEIGAKSLLILYPKKGTSEMYKPL